MPDLAANAGYDASPPAPPRRHHALLPARHVDALLVEVAHRAAQQGE